MLPPTLSVALKEWDAVTAALSSGRQMMLLRKGGIHETEGVFEIENRQFVLYPTFIHQHMDWIKQSDRATTVARTDEPSTVTFSTIGVVTDILRVRERARIDALNDQHIWLPPLINMRFDYKPHNPLYVLLVRAYHLPASVTVTQTPAYAGCRSWVPLEAALKTGGAAPVLDNAAYADRCAAFDALR